MAFEDDQGRSERRKNPNPIVGDQGSSGTGTGLGASSGSQADQDAYWRQWHGKQSFAGNRPYEDYQAGYRAGYEGYSKCQGKRTFADSENDLRQEYERNRGKSGLGWEHARQAARAAWDRLGRRRNRSAGVLRHENWLARFGQKSCGAGPHGARQRSRPSNPPAVFRGQDQRSPGFRCRD
jgi:hypothetical protein